MEGILAPLPWTVRRSFIRVPYVANPAHELRDCSFDDFPKHQGSLRTDSALDLIHSFRSVGELISFLQSWLFFGLLSAFLGDIIDQNELTVDGYIECHQEYLHDKFQR